ncbi:MAG: ribbon-helix-helix protein, CopG family [Chloroflexi bacterium]|nr:ribbon-helix-helix protein, CopG family [Chloroflexota bacterium]
MKTTLNLDAAILARLKAEAARRGQTMSSLVETALRNLFDQTEERPPLPPLPDLASGGARVDVANRSALYDVLGGR